MGLPGEENTFTVRIGSDYFENMGLLLFMAPATLSSLDILSDLREVKNRFGESGDSPVSYTHLDVYKRQAKTEMGCLLLKGGIDILSIKGLERCIQCRVQHPFITQAGRTAGRCNELFMQQKYLWFG